MDQLPTVAIPQGMPVFWGTLFVLGNAAVTLFCVFVIPALVKLRKAKMEDKQYLDDRADKGLQFVISQQRQDKEELKKQLDDVIIKLEARDAQLLESARSAERFKTQGENLEREVIRLRDQNQDQAKSITELRGEVDRLKDHDKRNTAHTEQLQEQVQTLAQGTPSK